MSKYILAHDLGTSGNKATLFSEEGALVDSQVYSYDTHYFNDTWVEQDAEDWWESSLQQQQKPDPVFRHRSERYCRHQFFRSDDGLSLRDKQGNPLRPSMIWADQRAQKQAQQIESKMSAWDYYTTVGIKTPLLMGFRN